MEPTSHRTDPIEAQAATETPLRRYLAELDQTPDGQQLLSHIRLFVGRAKLEGEQTAREIALEVLQEVVVEALRAEARYDAARSAKAWLLAFAANVVKRRREKLFRQRSHETVASDLTGDGNLTEEQLFDRLVALRRPGPSPEQEVVGALWLEEMLAALSPDDRRIIELCVLHTMQGAEVAQTLGISPGAARVRLHRALARLRTVWTERPAGREEKYNHE